MPAEWEPHSGCYLVWPERPDNWRLGAKPAQEAWVRVVEAISSGDAVTVLTSYGQWANARARLPEHVRVLETTTNDAWVRDSGPTFLMDDRGGLGAVDWAFNAWGGLRCGLYFPWDADDVVGSKIAELERATYWTRRPHPRGRLDRRRRPGHPADDRGVPAQPQPQPRPHARGRSRRCSATTSGWTG